MNNDIVVSTIETKYFISFTNPCIRTASIVPNSITSIDYWIKDPIATSSFTPHLDQATAIYGKITQSYTDFSTGDNLCG